MTIKQNAAFVSKLAGIIPATTDVHDGLKFHQFQLFSAIDNFGFGGDCGPRYQKTGAIFSAEALRELIALDDPRIIFSDTITNDMRRGYIQPFSTIYVLNPLVTVDGNIMTTLDVLQKTMVDFYYLKNHRREKGHLLGSIDCKSLLRDRRFISNVPVQSDLLLSKIDAGFLSLNVRFSSRGYRGSGIGEPKRYTDFLVSCCDWHPYGKYIDAIKQFKLLLEMCVKGVVDDFNRQNGGVS